MKGLANAEQEYAANIQKLVAPFQQSLLRTQEKAQKNLDSNTPLQTSQYNTTIASWERMLAGLEETAKIHVGLAESLSLERKLLKGKSKELDALNRETWMTIRASFLELQNMVDVMEKHHGKFDKEMLVVENASATIKKLVKEKRDKDVEKARYDLEKQFVNVKQASFAYKKAIDDVNAAKNKHFAGLIPECLDEVQQRDETDRILFTRDIMKKITERYCESLPKKEQMWKDTLGAVEAIDPAKDSNFLICAFKTGDKLPADFCFSDTQLEITKKLLLLPTAATPEESLEYLSSLPAKQGKKRALEKLKIIEKEIIELGKHKQSIDMLQLEFAKFPNADHALEELAEHTDQLKAKLDTLFVKKHSYDVYLAQLDDKPTPQSPALFQSQKTTDNAVANAVDLLAKSPADSACSPSSPPNHHQQDSQGTGSAHHSSVSKDPQPPSKTQSETKIGALPAIGSDPTELSALFDKGEEVVVLYDFEAAENSDEISILAGEKVEVVCVRDDGWSLVKWHAKNLEGIIPSSYIGK
ncbi:Formin-binding protein 1-like [Kappamyces sp. JEL0829]|nr:Formin-binding protein 1-like [Kappamyces sp. JEL0829]